MKMAWTDLATWSVQNATFEVKIGDVDVTKNSGLTGRFFITALPTIFHVKDGVFREYDGGRTAISFVVYLTQRQWLKTEPRAWYMQPTSFPMEIVSLFFKTALFVRELHTVMTEEYRVPVILSYFTFAIATALLGVVIALILVYMCDMLAPLFASRTPADQRGAEDSESDILEDDMPRAATLAGGDEARVGKPPGRAPTVLGGSTAPTVCEAAPLAGGDDAGLRQRLGAPTKGADTTTQ